MAPMTDAVDALARALFDMENQHDADNKPVAWSDIVAGWQDDYRAVAQNLTAALAALGYEVRPIVEAYEQAEQLYDNAAYGPPIHSVTAVDYTDLTPAVLLRDTLEDRERLIEKLRSEVLPPWWDGPLSDEPMDVADALIAALRGGSE